MSTHLFKRLFLSRCIAGLAGATLAARAGAGAGTLHAGCESWVHGHCADVGFPDLLDSVSSEGGSKVLRGRSYSLNYLHYGMPMPPGNCRAQAIVVRFKTLAGARLVSVRVFDGERELAVLQGRAITPGQWAECRFMLDHRPRIHRALGISLDIAFSDVQRECAISAVGAVFAA